MSLHDLLLGLLREPMSGTDLIRLFKGTVSHFWTTDLSQVYRSLESLETEGLVTSESVPNDRGPARRVYTLTADGAKRVAEWIRCGPRMPKAKFEYLAQLFSVTTDEEPGERARQLLEAMRPEAAGSVAVLEAIDARLSRSPGYPEALPAHLFYPWLTLNHGLLRRRAFLQWIDQSLEILKRRPAASDAATSPVTVDEVMDLLDLITRDSNEQSDSPSEDQEKSS